MTYQQFCARVETVRNMYSLDAEYMQDLYCVRMTSNHLLKLNFLNSQPRELRIQTDRWLEITSGTVGLPLFPIGTFGNISLLSESVSEWEHYTKILIDS